MNEFTYTPLLPVGEETTEFIKITDRFVNSFSMNGDVFLKIDPEGLSFLAQRAFEDVSHLLRPSHLQQLRNILDDKEAIEYLSNRADLHMKSFEKKVHRLHVDIDEEKLSEFDKKQFEHKKNYYTLVQGHIMQGQKSLKEMRKRKQLEGN